MVRKYMSVLVYAAIGGVLVALVLIALGIV
jgi:hypothetical protein